MGYTEIFFKDFNNLLGHSFRLFRKALPINGFSLIAFFFQSLNFAPFNIGMKFTLVDIELAEE